MDESNGLYDAVEKTKIGEGDRFRAMELQSQFIQFNFHISREQSLEDREKFMWAWEQSNSEFGPYDTEPIRWVLKNRQTVLAERDTFNSKLSAVDGWQERLRILDDFAKEKAANALILNEELSIRNRLLAEESKRWLEDELRKATRFKHAEDIINDWDSRKIEGALYGIESQLRSLNFDSR